MKLGDLEALQGVVKFPVRIKCATLSWNTLLQALERAHDVVSVHELLGRVGLRSATTSTPAAGSATGGDTLSGRRDVLTRRVADPATLTPSSAPIERAGEAPRPAQGP